MTRRIIAGVVVTFAVLRLATLPNDPPRPYTITEDDPRWDCHTMGNRVCGEVNR